MVKGYETLVDLGTKVDVNTGMIAAGRLQSLLDSRAGQPDVAGMMELNRIIDAVKSTVPQHMWGEIVEKLGQPQQHSKALDVEAETYDEADDPFDPHRIHR